MKLQFHIGYCILKTSKVEIIIRVGTSNTPKMLPQCKGRHEITTPTAPDQVTKHYIPACVLISLTKCKCASYVLKLITHTCAHTLMFARHVTIPNYTQ